MSNTILLRAFYQIIHTVEEKKAPRQPRYQTEDTEKPLCTFYCEFFTVQILLITHTYIYSASGIGSNLSADYYRGASNDGIHPQKEIPTETDGINEHGGRSMLDTFYIKQKKPPDICMIILAHFHTNK